MMLHRDSRDLLPDSAWRALAITWAFKALDACWPGSAGHVRELRALAELCLHDGQPEEGALAHLELRLVADFLYGAHGRVVPGTPGWLRDSANVLCAVVAAATPGPGHAAAVAVYDCCDAEYLPHETRFADIRAAMEKASAEESSKCAP
jgi:hypothetical protein